MPEESSPSKISWLDPSGWKPSAIQMSVPATASGITFEAWIAKQAVREPVKKQKPAPEVKPQVKPAAQVQGRISS